MLHLIIAGYMVDCMKKLTFTLPLDLVRTLKHYCVNKNITMKKFLIDAIEQKLIQENKNDISMESQRTHIGSDSASNS